MGSFNLASKSTRVPTASCPQVALVEVSGRDNPLFRRAIDDAMLQLFGAEVAFLPGADPSPDPVDAPRVLYVRSVDVEAFAENDVELVIIEHVERADNLQAALSLVAEMADAMPQTPCVFATDSAEKLVADKAVELGASLVLRKPIGAAALAGRLQTLSSIEPQESVAQSLVNAEALEQLKREYSPLARLLVHDLRGPLTVMSSALSYLETEGLAPEGEELLWECQDALKRMCSMVNNISAEAQFAQGVMYPHTDEFDLGVLVAEVVADLRDVFRLQALRVELNIATSAQMSGSVEGIRRMLGNLVANAAEYSPLEGAVGISLEGENEETVLRVSDEGVAVPAALMAATLELREQSRLKVQGVRLGKGLSLIVAREIVESHQGTLSLKPGATEFERGLVVEVRFPRH